MTERMKSLLREASRAYREMRNPFDIDFLQEHTVTSDECADMAQAISAAIDILLVKMAETATAAMLLQTLTRDNG